MSRHIFSKLTRLDYFIRNKASGSPAELAEKLGISRSQLYNYIDLLESMGASISFSRKRNCFYYEENGSFRFTFSKSDSEQGDP